MEIYLMRLTFQWEYSRAQYWALYCIYYKLMISCKAVVKADNFYMRYFRDVHPNFEAF